MARETSRRDYERRAILAALAVAPLAPSHRVVVEIASTSVWEIDVNKEKIVLRPGQILVDDALIDLARQKKIPVRERIIRESDFQELIALAADKRSSRTRESGPR